MILLCPPHSHPNKTHSGPRRPVQTSRGPRDLKGRAGTVMSADRHDIHILKLHSALLNMHAACLDHKQEQLLAEGL